MWNKFKIDNKHTFSSVSIKKLTSQQVNREDGVK